MKRLVEQKTSNPAGLEERRQEREIRLKTSWYPGDMLALEGPLASHADMCAWQLAPQLHSVVHTIFLCHDRLDVLPNDIVIEILKCLRCGDFGQPLALPAP